MQDDLDGIILYYMWGRRGIGRDRKNRRKKVNSEDIVYFSKGAGIVGHPEGNQAAPPRQGDPTVR